MDADVNHGDKKRIVFFPMYHHTVEPIVIKDPVVDPFGGRALSIDLFIGIGAAGDIGIQADIPVRSCFDNPSIFGRGTGRFTFCCMFFTERAAPHEITGTFIITVWKHGKACIA